MTPIPKVNPPWKIESDLRSILLTPVLAKHFESIVGQWILDSIEDKMDVSQYEGMKGMSTTHALLDVNQYGGMKELSHYTRPSGYVTLLV